jgi:hypothetical protein
MFTWFWRWWADEQVRGGQYSGPTRLHAIQHFARMPMPCKYCGQPHPKHDPCNQVPPPKIDKGAL